MAGVEAAPSQSTTFSNGYKISRVIKLKDHAFGYRMSQNLSPQLGTDGIRNDAARVVVEANPIKGALS